MQRQEDIRAVIQTLLASQRRSEPGESAAAPRPAANTIVLTEAQSGFLRDLQDSLFENGIEASPAEIGQALLHALSSRPRLCRGLIAAYLVEG